MTANSKAISTRVQPSRSGQRAHDLRIGPQPEYVAEERTHLNRVLIEPLTNEALRDEWQVIKKKVGKQSKIRSNQNLSYAGIITFGIEAQKIFEALSDAQQDAAFLEVGQKISERFGTRLTGMVSHYDETALHAHYQLRGIADDGTMLSQIVKRGALREIQDIAAEAVGKFATGIERGKDKWARIEEGEDFAATVNRSVSELHDDLKPEIAAKKEELQKLNATLETHLKRLAKAQDKANDEGKKADAARKLVTTYERRSNKAREDIETLSSEIERLQQTHDTLDKTLAQKKTKVVSLRTKAETLRARLKALNAA